MKSDIMSDDIRTESSKFESTRTLMETQHQETLRALKDKLHREVQNTIERNQQMKDNLEQAYNVELSKKKEDYDEKLAELRNSMTKQIEGEKLIGETEVEKTRARYHEQVSRYREVGEKQIADLHRQYQRSADDMRVRMEREKSKS